MQPDIHDLIEDAEQALVHMQQLAANEAAMNEVLPARFAANLAAFSRHIPGIAKQFEHYQPKRPMEFFCLENGIPNLRWLDTQRTQYGADPYQECSAQIDEVLKHGAISRFGFHTEPNRANQIHIDFMNQLAMLNMEAEANLKIGSSEMNSVPMSIMFGVGLGYQLGYLFERCDIANIFIFEPDLDMFYASLFTFDWAPWLDFMHQESKGVHIFLGQDEETILTDFLQQVGKYGNFLFMAVLGFWHYHSEKIFKLIERVLAEFHLVSMGWGFFDDNLFAMSHSIDNIVHHVPFLNDSVKNNVNLDEVPVFVIGNGPSLDPAIELIKEHQTKAVVIACGSALASLHRVGIKPDIYVAVERVKAMSDLLDVMGDTDYLKDILFLSVDVIHPDHRKFFQKIGLGFKPFEPMVELLSINHPELAPWLNPLSSVNPLAGNIGLSMPIRLGFKNIYMFGLDNGCRDGGHHHSKESVYYGADGNALPAFSGGPFGESFAVPANFGGIALTSTVFSASAHVMGNLLESEPTVKCYNTSDGVLVRGAIPLPLANFTMCNSEIDKASLVDDIYQHIFSPIPLSRDGLEGLLNQTSFDNVIDVLVSDWDDIDHLNRVELIERMQKQYDFLRLIGETKERQVYRFLVGTVNYVFSILCVLAYRYEDEEKSMIYAAQAIKLIQSYLLATKERYKEAIHFVDSSDYDFVSLYRGA